MYCLIYEGWFCAEPNKDEEGKSSAGVVGLKIREKV